LFIYLSSFISSLISNYLILYSIKKKKKINKNKKKKNKPFKNKKKKKLIFKEKEKKKYKLFIYIIFSS
jgi:hypothetical protein